jgi:hypothetical protein
MSAVYKFINNSANSTYGLEISLSSANTVYNARLARITNANNSLTVLTIANTTTTYANVTLVPYETITVEKSANDTFSGVNLRAVQVAYRN